MIAQIPTDDLLAMSPRTLFGLLEEQEEMLTIIAGVDPTSEMQAAALMRDARALEEYAGRIVGVLVTKAATR